jgi:hypothetical protein
MFSLHPLLQKLRDEILEKVQSDIYNHFDGEFIREGKEGVKSLNI